MISSAFSGESTLAIASFKAFLTGLAWAFSSGVGISHGGTGVSPNFCSGALVDFGFLSLSLGVPMNKSLISNDVSLCYRLMLSKRITGLSAMEIYRLKPPAD